ncbi:FecR domain-containing protein [Parapedobacter sp. ISTM3]|uniref:FecR family protein n=1 Tax=Parapedobacter sp. ISTM3 TaxID=2800130 RepID=UPI0019067904|nr:FecR domain-containing protein [Parapedobacter sp. ISTM3]
MKLATLQKLLKRYHDGIATKAERYVVDQWYESFGGDPEAVPGLQTEAEKTALKSRLWQALPKQRKPIRWYKQHAFRIAASLTLLLGAAVWLYLVRDPAGQSAAQLAKTNNRWHVITTGGRQLKQVQLPDSTQVWLNANSNLKVLPGYGVDARRISLSGEAFFEVTRDTVRPFVVEADGITVKVLGTSFNLRSYESLQEIKVAVSTGRVLVTNAAAQQLSELTVGQELAYRRADKTFRVGNVAVADSRSWREGRIVLDRASFDELVQGFYNRYGVRLTTADQDVASYRYNLTLQPTYRLEEAIALVCTTLHKNYRKEENGTIRIY